jgi:hypothetical protein
VECAQVRRIAEAEHSHDGGGAAAFAAAGLQVRPLAKEPFSCRPLDFYLLLAIPKECGRRTGTMLILGAQVRLCPRCGTAIEKNEGCSSMDCYLCGHHFDWSEATRVKAKPTRPGGGDGGKVAAARKSRSSTSNETSSHGGNAHGAPATQPPSAALAAADPAVEREPEPLAEPEPEAERAQSKAEKLRVARASKPCRFLLWLVRSSSSTTK